jgi:hypothetical protein
MLLDVLGYFGLDILELDLALTDIHHHLVADIQFAYISYLFLLDEVDTVAKFGEQFPDLRIDLGVHSEQILEFGDEEDLEIAVSELVIFALEFLVLQ